MTEKTTRSKTAELLARKRKELAELETRAKEEAAARTRKDEQGPPVTKLNQLARHAKRLMQAKFLLGIHGSTVGTVAQRSGAVDHIDAVIAKMKKKHTAGREARVNYQTKYNEELPGELKAWPEEEKR